MLNTVKLLKLIKKLSLGFEVFIAPFIAKYLKYLLYPFYKIFKLLDYVFIVNISSCTGHITAEIDYFFQMRQSQHITSKKNYIWIAKSNTFTRVIPKLYKSQFHKIFINDFLYLLILPILMAFENLIIDCSLSHEKFQIMNYRKYSPRYRFLKTLSLNECLLNWINFYKFKEENMNFFPLKRGNFQNQAILKFLGEHRKKLALIHIKDSIANATGKVTDPNTYLPTLAHLFSLGYQLIFVGREKMPENFKTYKVLNYAESKIASFAHDLALFNLAELAIVGGSGISLLPECFDLPFLFLNSWHTITTPFSRKCVMVPSLLQSPGGQLVNFSQQMQLEYESYQFNPSDRSYKAPQLDPLRINNENYSIINVSADQILEASKELLSLMKRSTPLSELQLKYRTLERRFPRYYSKNRCSNYFLQQYQNLI